ncbi:MAG TPA: hypothetical protein VMU01_08840 [Rhizomicrobium sp.]|nr:hypothetical protein [Rhizomicrobium sp.]
MGHTALRSIALGMSAVAFCLAAYAADKSSSMSGSMSTMSGPMNASAGDAKLIVSAMSAAPKAVSASATVVALDASGKMRTLRAGSNGWTCIPDDPSTPGPDPMCMDKNAMEFIGAMSARKPPPKGKVGFMYMLAGGTDASNTDPFATKPTASNHWIKTGPHVMILGADQAFYDQYPKSADPDTKAPYVMWAGTPYQHLMVPVK